MREARVEWAADSPPNPDWAGANPETRVWFNQYAKLWQELRVRTLEQGVGIGLNAASSLTREQLTELDQFAGSRPGEHESIVRKDLGQVVDALNAKLAAHERPRLRGEIGRGRLQNPAPAAVSQPSETPATRGPAFGRGLLLLGGAFGAAAGARKAVQEGDYSGAALAAIPSLAFASIPAIPDLARWRAQKAVQGGRYLSAAKWTKVAERGGSVVGLLFAAEALYSSVEATARAATAQKKADDPNASTEDLKAAKEAQHDKALAVINAGTALLGIGASLPRGKLGFGLSASVGVAGLAINAYDTFAQYAGWKDLGALVATNSKAGKLADDVRTIGPVMV